MSFYNQCSNRYFLLFASFFFLELPIQPAIAEQWIRHELSRDFYSEGGCIADIDKDGNNDLIAGPFVYYGPTYEFKSTIYEPKPFSIIGYSDNFLSYATDINFDGFPDVVVFGFPGKETLYFENPGQSVRGENSWQRHVALDVTDNESPMLTDVTGDGRPDIVCCQGGHFGYAEIPHDPRKRWVFVPVSENGGYQRFTHGIGVGDVNDDGFPDMLAANGWWQNPGDLHNDKVSTATKPLWKFHAVQFAETGAQIFAVDFDGDNQTEVVTSLQAHGYGLVMYDKIKSSGNDEWSWQQQVIMTNDAATSPTQLAISQLHAIEIADINGDQLPDIVTGKRFWAHQGKDVAENDPPHLVWFATILSTNGSVRFVPHIVDSDSGVGTQITVLDMNHDSRPDIFSVSKRGVHIFLQTNDDDPNGNLNRLQQINKQFATVAENMIHVEGPISGYRPANSLGEALNFDFESGKLDDWRGTGAAFFNQPELVVKVSETLKEQLQSNGGGSYLIHTSHIVGTIGEGQLESKPFRLVKPKISYLIGGSSSAETRLELVDFETGEVLHKQSGNDQHNLTRIEVDVSKFIDKAVVIRLIDANALDNGYLCFDDFLMHDL